MNEKPAPPEPAPIPPAPKCRTFTAEEKAQWTQKFLASGLSLRKFSQEHQLPCMSLWRWVHPRRARAMGPSTLAAADFAELKLPAADGDWAVELTLPNGTLLRMSKDVPPGMVEQLLRLC